MNLDRTAVIKLAVAMLCAQMRRTGLLDDKAPAAGQDATSSRDAD